MDENESLILFCFFAAFMCLSIWWYSKKEDINERLKVRRADRRDTILKLNLRQLKRTLPIWAAEKIKEYRSYAKLSPGQRIDYEERLLAAGKPFGWIAEDLYLLEKVSGIVVAFIFSIIIYISFDITMVLVGVSLGSIIGQKVPKDSLIRLSAKRQAEARSKLAEALDRIAICASASNTLLDTLRGASKQGDNILYKEMRRVVNETDQGRPLEESLYFFKCRIELAEINDVYQTMVNASQQGSFILNQRMSEIADMVRQQERERITQAGAKAQANMSVPLLVCMVPVIVIMFLGPPIISTVSSILNK